MLNRFIAVHALGFMWFNMVHMTNWVINGLPERFPKLKTMWIESGLTWAYSLMQRLDHSYMMRTSDCPQLKRKPSEYIKEMYFSSQPIERDHMELWHWAFAPGDAHPSEAHAQGTRDPLASPHPWYLLAEAADSGAPERLRESMERALVECAGRGALADAAVAQSGEQARAFWRLRESIPEAQFANVKHDVSVPVSRTPELIDEASRALEAAYPGAPIYAFGHLGDGNIHFNVGAEALLAQSEAVNRIVYGVVARLGGSISAEHGIGQLKREEIRRHKDALELELMAALKRTLDPAGLMNPGKLL